MRRSSKALIIETGSYQSENEARGSFSRCETATTSITSLLSFPGRRLTSRSFSSVSCVNSESGTILGGSEFSRILLELHAAFPTDFSVIEKLDLLELCYDNKVLHHKEIAVLTLELWKNIGHLKQCDISRCHKLFKDIGDELCAVKEGRREPLKLYEDQFHWDLTMLHNHVLSPTLEQYRKKQDLIQSLKVTLERAANGTLHTFGSCENGLWVRGSDVDMCLEIPNCNHKRQWLSKLNLIRSTLSNSDIISHISIISAKVPIAKLYNRDNHNFCDISINNTVALNNTRFVKAMTRLDFRVVKLARFIKYWATCRCINNRSQGTLSSYTLILQLFYFMQNRSPPILPLFKDIETSIEGSDDEERTSFMTDSSDIFAKCDYLQQNTESITELLFDFFRFYSDKRFQGGRRGATVDLYTNEIAENNLGVLVMKCPITGKNVNPFTIRMWQSIYREFKRVDDCINDQRPVSQICIKATKPPLEKEAELQRSHSLMIRHIVLAACGQKQKNRSKSVLKRT
ncbi:UTP:RNA uridylyltransferase 1 [Babesia sp. Xinjiang]|uniref:UTP:RNA uridylyltransferase 1 n=1 Tax=Babesia sp. Xinjiang TaxID=462227 RepID=UPI000A237EDA|nr:UTP:RNA uridylyltransferase 1 [Babesia sp. Xinjiang]ORM40297.1 UTP:RNA uridylyltransferase 1 [Babesia sp. Xinjiang]